MSAKYLTQLFIIVMLVMALLATTLPAQAWSGCGNSYVVRWGDWLSKIANRCGVSLSALINANPWVRYQYYIYPGQVLTIPGGYYGGCGPTSDAYGSFYVVCRGDTLGGIALYYGVSIWHLKWKNNIVNSNVIYPGQVIRP